MEDQVNHVTTDHEMEKIVLDEMSSLPFTNKSEISLLNNLLRDQIRLNKSLEEKNLTLHNKAIQLKTQCEELKARLALASRAKASKIDSKVPESEESVLESEMLKAKINSSILKSIVTPLEQEVLVLKKRLHETEACLSISCYPVVPFHEVPPDAISNSGDNLSETSETQQMEQASPATLFNKITYDTSGFPFQEFTPNEIKSKLDDAQTYVLALAKHKNSLVETVASLKSTNAHLATSLEQEKAAHNELKETWEKANEQFILQSLNFQHEIQALREKYNISAQVSPNSKDTLAKSYPDRCIHDCNTYDGSSNQSILKLQAEIAHLKEELESEKTRSRDLEMGIKLAITDVTTQLQRAEDDFSVIDTFLTEVREELYQNKITPPTSSTDLACPNLFTLSEEYEIPSTQQLEQLHTSTSSPANKSTTIPSTDDDLLQI